MDGTLPIKRLKTLIERRLTRRIIAGGVVMIVGVEMSISNVPATPECIYNNVLALSHGVSEPSKN
jgi:hypothetical protein